MFTVTDFNCTVLRFHEMFVTGAEFVEYAVLIVG